ncbi:hypothetical protein QCA50_010487 [Cerrena zonata]|uniref:DUF202 domain-containing protein n=1 Tax=Cerrena zonata TaxID=2478898 RepID=A0AAW0G423_9APHY
MPLLLKVHGSNVRDFVMLERNLLTHLRFAIALTLFAASMLLNARLPSPDSSGRTSESDSNIPLAALQASAAVVTISIGLWEYHRSFKDMCEMKAFLTATKPHLVVMSVISLGVFATCVVLLAGIGQA